MYRFSMWLALLSVPVLAALSSLDRRSLAVASPGVPIAGIEGTSQALAKRQTVPRRDRGAPADSEGSGTR